jgi:hypothetical protein
MSAERSGRPLSYLSWPDAIAPLGYYPTVRVGVRVHRFPSRAGALSSGRSKTPGNYLP